MWTRWARWIPHDYWDPIEANARGDWCWTRTSSTSWPAASGSRFRSTMPPRWCRSIRWWASSAFTMPASSIPVSALSRASRPRRARVLEVRSREVPFILEHGQIIGRLVFERLTDPPPEGLWRGPGFQLSAPGPEAFQAFPVAVTVRQHRCRIATKLLPKIHIASAKAMQSRKAVASRPSVRHS